MVKDVELYQRLRQFFEKALLLLQNEHFPDAISMLRKEEELETLSEFKNLRQYISETPRLNAQLLVIRPDIPVQDWIQGLYLFHNLVLPIASAYFEESNTLDFKEDIFDRVYQGVDQYLHSASILVKDVAPIEGLSAIFAKPRQIELDSGIMVRPLTLEERKQLWHDQKRSAGSLYCVEVIRQVKKEHFPSDDYLTVLSLIEVLFRLCKRQPFSIRFVMRQNDPWYLGTDRCAYRGYIYLAGPTIHFTQPVLPHRRVLKNPEVMMLKTYWPKLVTMMERRRFGLAVSRYSSSYEKTIPEDRLIDLWVGLELLCPKVGSRLGRIATFLGLFGSEKNKVIKPLKGCRDLRHDIMHGNEYDLSNVAGLLAKTEEILADLIFRCLELGKLLDENECQGSYDTA